VEGNNGLPNQHKVVLDGLAPDEGALVGVDQLGYQWRQPPSHDFGEQLREIVHQTNESKVVHLVGFVFLWDERNEGIVEATNELLMATENHAQRGQHVFLDVPPANVEEVPGKPIRPR
jgi:hypothetical protein